MDAVLALKIVKVLLVLGAAVYVVSQVRKPDRLAGRLFAMLMNQSHSKLTDWGLMHTRVEMGFTILDVGCGGGRTVGKLAAMASNGKVYGIDYAAGSVATSRSRNEELIRAGRVEIQQAPVSKLPFAADTFDLVTAIETQYYWPDLPSDMREVLRVLKSGGVLAIIAETYKGGSRDLVLGTVMKLFGSPNLGVIEHKELFAKAGYINVEVFEEQKKGWICITGRKPRTVA